MSSSGAGTSRSDGGDGVPDNPPELASGIMAGLHELHRLLGSSEPGSCEAALGLLRSLGEECVISAPGSSVLALNTSLVFSKDYGLLVFIHKSLSIEEYRDCREEALKFLCTFLEKIDKHSQPYALDIKRICVVVYTKEKYAKCKVAALDLLIKLLKKSYKIEEFKIGEIFNKFYGELANKSKLSDTVLEKTYELLGILGEVQPSDMLNNSEKLFRAYLGELKGQMTSSTRQPKFAVVAGCLRGLSALLINFTKSVEEDARTSKEIFEYTIKAINPQIDLKRYAVPLAGLNLLAQHASQFNTYLMDTYRTVFEVMSKWCGHLNHEVKKSAFAAMDSFLKQIALLVTNDAVAHKDKLQFFMEQFYKIIRKMDCSNKELSIAIRGYGFFAAPCKAVNAKDVDFMYLELIQCCKQMYLTEAETEDDNVYQLPNFLQAIASVILHMDSIPEIYTPVLERLLVVQIETFPRYSLKMQPSCSRSIIKVFLSLAGKGPVLWSLISTVVHQGLIRVCSKPVRFNGNEKERSDDPSTSGEVRAGRWKVPTYQDYLDLFRNLMNCDQIKESIFSDEVFPALNSPLQSLSRLLYDELIKSVLKIIEKLDLSLQKQESAQEVNEDRLSYLLIATSDPAANLYPTKPKDFTAFVNLVDFCSEIITNKHVEFFEPWVYVFGYELVLKSTRLPLISGFYSLLSIVMKNAKKLKYFEGVSPKSSVKFPQSKEKCSCFALFLKFGKEVSSKMKQFKDELLASCLTLILSLPHEIIMHDIKAYIPSLQTAFKLGLSFPPLANAGLDALEDWSSRIPPDHMEPHYKDILPSLDGYLTDTSSTDESLNALDIDRLSRASQKGFNKYLIKQIQRTKTLSVNDDSSLTAVRSRVVRLLGSLGGHINRSLVTATSTEEMIKKHVSWDTEKRLSFAVPFADLKPVIYLDTFLPRVTDLALSASDRQTKEVLYLPEKLLGTSNPIMGTLYLPIFWKGFYLKAVAACELFHSMVTFMLGKAREGSPSMYRLYKHTFPVLLRLACDVDQVTRQLYEPLVMGIIHWFTNTQTFESPDTVALLDAILDGIVDPSNSTLRDFSGQCIQEFLKWSIKQTTPRQQEQSPVNTQSLFKRLYSLALHPSAFKRLGAALAFNNVYREFREEEALVEQFVFEILVVYMQSLALSHGDEKSLGTIQQCSDAIDHLKRIIIQKANSLNKSSKRRIPRGFPRSQTICLLDIVLWLLQQCGVPQTDCRHKAMELFFEFVPLLPEKKSPSAWVEEMIKKEGISFLIQRFESAGSMDGNHCGILYITTLHDLQQTSLCAALQWMDMLLAALDCYNTFMGMRVVKPQTLLAPSQKSSFLRALLFFIQHLSMQDIMAAQTCFKTSLFSPQEREEYNYSKCTIIVRIIEFVTMILENCQQDFLQNLENELLTDFLWDLTAITVCDPSDIGFNTADVQVMKNLPDVCVQFLKAVAKSPYKRTLDVCFQKKITLERIEDLCAVKLYDPDTRYESVKLRATLSACNQLYRSQLLNSTLHAQVTGLGFSVGSKLLSVVYKGISAGNDRKSLPSLDVSSKRLAEGILQLAFNFGGQCEELVSLLLNTVVLTVSLPGSSQRNFINFSHGEYFYNLFSETINSELLKNLDTVVPYLLRSSTENPKMVSSVLNGMLDQSFRQRSVQKQQGTRLVNAVLKNWMKLESWWATDSSPENKMAVLTLLAKVLQIESSVSFDTNHLAFNEVFKTYLSILSDQNLSLNLKSQAIIILPFFTNLKEEKLSELKNTIDQFVAFNFPLKSDEFPKGTLKFNNYVDCIKKFLDALELSQCSVLLHLMAEVLCRDGKHFMEDLFQSTFKKVIKRSSCDKQIILMDTIHNMFNSDDILLNTTRLSLVDRCLLTFLWNCSSDALKDFYSKIIVFSMDVLKTRFTKTSETVFDTQLTKKIGYYKLLEVLYSRLSKDEIYSKESRINHAFEKSANVEGNMLTKTLIKSCYDAYTENMSGETQLLEKRRLHHCAAYNCAIAVVTCTFTEIKFYQGFLLSEKKEKNIFILENIIDLKRNYSFPIEVEVPMERKKKYLAIRKEARETSNEDSDGPQYLSSQSYMADSSLSEEMSQFDFSTGIQSFSYRSLDPVKFQRSKRIKHSSSEVQTPEDIMELEMDELNQHECMAQMTAMIKHMQQKNITPKVEEGTIPQDLPPWMTFLHCKLGNSSTPLNIRLFISKLIINVEEVFRPYAKFWIGPLLQLMVSGNNGGTGIHYFVVETVVTLLSWSGVATPNGHAKDEILANRLLEFMMKNSFHEKRAVYRHNLEIIKTVLECWKDCLCIPYRLIYDGFSGTDSNTKDNSLGIQLLGLVVVNNFSPYDPKCEIDSDRYFKALAINVTFTRFKEVYAAASEVLGLVLRYIAEKEKDIEGPLFAYVEKNLKSLQASNKEDKFIVCLNKIVKNFPLISDRFMNIVLYLLPKLHGVLKTQCLEIIMSRAEEIPDLFLELKNRDFKQIMSNRDDERQRVCLEIVYKLLAKLTPSELRELLPSVTSFSSHNFPVCRERMYDILMWIYDNYRDLESQSDSDSQDIFNMAKETLLEGMVDENAELQLIVRNFWSDETRLPTSTKDRMVTVLCSLYSPKIEKHFLSLATNLLLEMTSRSPDYVRQMFEHPLSECMFQDYTVDSSWRHRSTILTPMFVETQASQSVHRSRTQSFVEGHEPEGGQLRATQQHYQFTPTQNIGGRSSFNWLTGSSMDTLGSYSADSSDSLSSTLLFTSRSEKAQRGSFKPVGPNFGKRRLGLPGDETDSKAKGIEKRSEILRLRRRFLKDQEKLSIIYAKKGSAEQKKEKELKVEQKMKQDAQVILYRSYRHGDLPDIQIAYSALIAPLQALAQKDPALAKQLFSALFSGILEDINSSTEIKIIATKLIDKFNLYLNSTVYYFPPFIGCIQDMCYHHVELLELNPTSVSRSGIESLQQSIGILLLEKALQYISPPEEPPTKKMRGRADTPPDVLRWIQLARLYRSIDDYDVLRGIFSNKIGTKDITQRALNAEARSDYGEAAKLYDEALQKTFSDGEPSDSEKDFWEIASMECYNHLTEWKPLEYCSTVNIDSQMPPDLKKMWSDPFYEETYLPYMIRSKVKLLLNGENDQSLLTFIDDAMKIEQRKVSIETFYSQEMSLLYILQEDFDRARYYIKNGIDMFIQNYSSIDSILYHSRLTQLQTVQALTETQDFINFICIPGNLSSLPSLRRLFYLWMSRYPDEKMDPMHIWDDVITNRCFFLDKIKEKLSSQLLEESMEIDSVSENSEVLQGDKQEDVNFLIRKCKFVMKMKMVDSARKQNNFSVAMKLLKELHRESKTNEDWLVKWVQSYCRYSHSRSHTQSNTEKILTVLKTISLLGESNSDYLKRFPQLYRYHNMLLGGTYRIMGDALSKEPVSLNHIEESKARIVKELSGSEEEVAAGLYRKCLHYLKSAVRKAEEETQSHSTDWTDNKGVIKAYMTLVDFCDTHLRNLEDGSAVLNVQDCKLFPEIIVDKMIKALKLGSKEARLKFPRLLQIIELYPNETLDLMAREASSVPCWLFIGWISQMMAMLDKKESLAVQFIMEEIVDYYPQALVYPFMISGENFNFEDTVDGHRNKLFIEKIQKKLDKNGLIKDFIQALEQLSNPALILQDWKEEVYKELAKPKPDINKIKMMYKKMHANLANVKDPHFGSFRRKFAEKYSKDLEKVCGSDGSLLSGIKADKFNDSSFVKLVNKIKDESPAEPGNLKEYSPWMSIFKPEFSRDLEIPGQYDGKNKPMPEYHIKICGFDERVKVMTSIRRPKKIIIRGNDERDYPFLVKGGEDLRQDQRIEQLFDIINIILSQDAACKQRYMQIKTYQVIPMTTRIGMIEWLENTCTLKDFILSTLTIPERKDFYGIYSPENHYIAWLKKKCKIESLLIQHIDAYIKMDCASTVSSFRERESLVPGDLLRRAFIKMSATPEAFLALRSHFVQSHALLCISHWILGIGDRHLSNFMVNMETGGMIGIDFGHAFGTATQFLPVPELMPFRLTRQIINLMLPLKETGLFDSVMVHALRAFRRNPDLLISTMDVFVKEPSLDWKNFAAKQLKKGGDWVKGINTTSQDWYPTQKINCAKRKLAGANPAVITCEELRFGHTGRKELNKFCEVAKGDKDNIRAKMPDDGLSEEIQVKCLIAQATDPNILGRVWKGWEPWI
ncbi:DNA-dependent protein kinase catalytic subunit isoform X2 [Hyla sarda]|uniref:DNA-dependent protein kinase catalytic subunit isoform X2 n=1 Tax=Hyla sarda TaxID=327740 RepID=UPI0024C3906C|nr:DNA-dependent protein kinase catalytic subunit isoform X2 [Hyla sarda]